MAINQYKDGKGVNDHKKGNRTRTGRNPKPAIEINKQIGEDIAHYKEIAEKVRRSRKYKQEDVIEVYRRLNEYMDRQTAEERPLTVSGMIKASGISKSTWYEMLGGDYDYQLYQLIDTYNIDTNNIVDELDTIPVASITVNGQNVDVMLIRWSEILQKAMLSIEEQTEERLYSKGRVGDIFSLKAVHGWQEDQTPHTVNQTLIIGESDARKAIEALEKARLP